jgi:hypothetical protein
MSDSFKTQSSRLEIKGLLADTKSIEVDYYQKLVSYIQLVVSFSQIVGQDLTERAIR